MTRSTALLLFVFCFLEMGAQLPSKELVLKRGRGYAKVLASPELAGRGYQDDGALRAAHYIADQFKKHGLEPLPNSNSKESPYFQDFTFGTNLIDSLSLVLDGTKMKEGEQFIAASLTGRGLVKETKVYDLKYGLPKNFKQNYQGSIVLFRSGLPPKKAKKKAFVEANKEYRRDQAKLNLAKKAGAEAVIVLKNKLTAGFNPLPISYPVMEVLTDELPKKKVKRAALEVGSGLRKIPTQNVMAQIKGKTNPDSVIVICGHYDHLGKQGEAIFYGGNDNASGTSMLMAMAEHYAQPGNRPNYTLVFIAFGAEEAGLHGSKYYVENPMIPLENTVFVLDMDLMGNGDKGITAVAGADYPEYLALMQDENEKQEAVPVVKSRGNRANSDHYFFTQAGVPSLFIYTMGGPPHYHDIYDTYENLTFSRYAEVHNLFLGFLNRLME